MPKGPRGEKHPADTVGNLKAPALARGRDHK